MSLWKGSKNGEQQEAEDEGQPRPSSSSQERSERHSEEPTERTRLIAQRRPPPAGGYLDPDDPAVSFFQIQASTADGDLGQSIQPLERTSSQMV